MKVVMVAEAGSARLRRGGGWLGGRGRKSWGTLGLAWILDFGFGFGFAATATDPPPLNY